MPRRYREDELLALHAAAASHAKDAGVPLVPIMSHNLADMLPFVRVRDPDLTHFRELVRAAPRVYYSWDMADVRGDEREEILAFLLLAVLDGVLHVWQFQSPDSVSPGPGMLPN